MDSTNISLDIPVREKAADGKRARASLVKNSQDDVPDTSTKDGKGGSFR